MNLEYTTSILNIGLANTGCASIQQAATVALHILGTANVRTHAVVQSETEPTLVVELYVDAGPGRVYELAKTLNQQAIAYYNVRGDFGLLIGPKSAQWGRFDANRFFTIEGTKLGDELLLDELKA